VSIIIRHPRKKERKERKKEKKPVTLNSSLPQLQKVDKNCPKKISKRGV
jgi:hypothetical protein